ncbi:MAG: DNA topoisomerase IB [Rudaea sp.]|uniref:DNA topoisomerase IB n=1 Tax=unclassified Rudaea TaxID=2627037 RepID=UPI0014851D68|nr:MULTISPECIES: DNA topoisomerase IB [unclassified Rudaea]MBN8887430.1 DNA topoisomerase IB [Rudaea sp.]MBR0346664.1 DNA topoisomerase IB [Rudaea sp.]
MRLVYVSDDEPGLRRQRRRGRFVYFGARGEVKSPAVLRRIRKLAIPPAYVDVWICRKDSGHLQATGRDAKGRKQYRYHADWRKVRDAAKFDRLAAFSQGLPKLRRQIAADLLRPGLCRDKVIAAVVLLLQHSLIRIGNEQYTRSNGSYGLTTLRNRHVEIFGRKIEFKFRGKSGRFHTVRLADPRLARIMRRCQELPGQYLFQYRNDEGGVERIDSNDVNAYLHASLGEMFSAKDFRTWAATVLAAQYLAGQADAAPADRARRMGEAVEYVAKRLGNTAAICRKSYIHPGILLAYEKGDLYMPANGKAIGLRSLSASERSVQKLLQRQRISGNKRRAHARGAASA